LAISGSGFITSNDGSIYIQMEGITVDLSVREELKKKVGKAAGKGLSSNDFTDQEKDKLESLQNYDDTEVYQAITDETTARNAHATAP
jgi:hypothetical protein